MLTKLILISILTLSVVVADDADNGPGRGVARISLINGDVSIRRGDSGDFIAAALNAPLVVQDRVFTGVNSRSELQFDWANMIRMGANAEVRLAELEQRRYLIQIAKGTVTFRVLRDIDAEVELSTPSVSVRPVKKGTYRITVNEDGTSEITVRSGEAEIFTPRGSQRLQSGKTMHARGTASDPEVREGAEIPDDDWDHWNQRRDRDLERSRSYDHISRDIYGAEDLDGHGRWVNAPGYGTVWTPNVAVGWAPYRHGRWSWVDWYGWSWVSYDPWGWAPYHYGRWFHSSPYGWCWYPGQRYSRHYWSPALVAFVGFGNVSVGFGFGRVGWIPLAPYERHHRWWGNSYYGGYRNRNYVDNRVHVVNNVNITNIYRNSRIDNAITGVDQDGFSRGRSGSSIRMRDADFSRASLVQGQVPVTPDRASLRMADREATAIPEGRGADRFFARRQATAVDKVPFEDQRRGVEQVARRTFGEQARPAPDGSVRRTFTAETPSSVTGESGRGWRRVGDPAADRGGDRRFGEPATGRASEERRGASGDGWRRFGGGRLSDGGRSTDSNSARGSGTVSGSAASEPGFSNRRSEQTDGWRRGLSPQTDSSRTESPRMERSESPRVERTREPRVESRSEARFEAPRADSPSRRSDSPRVERRNEESIRISPPIVRERGGDRGGSYRGAERSSPAPAAPRMDGGDGGRGAARSGGESRGGGESRIRGSGR